MSDIRVGDLVMVVRPTPCCGRAGSIGQVFTAIQVGIAPVTWCSRCFKDYGPVRGVYIGADKDSSGWIVASRLKRIPPLDELERTETVKKLTEPA